LLLNGATIDRSQALAGRCLLNANVALDGRRGDSGWQVYLALEPAWTLPLSCSSN
jgi:hypothetical protein